MNKIILTLITLVAAALSAAAAPDWHDDILSTMNSTDNVDRNIVVNRQPSTRVITAANYRYTFKSKALYASIRSKLLSREPDATSVIIRPGKDGEIIMKFKRSNETRNYSLSRIKGRYQLIISVNEEQELARQREQVRKQAAEARQQAQKARQEAQKARQEAQRQAQIARQEAQKARQEAQRQAQIARQEAQRQAQIARQEAQKARQQAQSQARIARQEAQKARRQAAQSRNSSSTKTIIISDSGSNSDDIKSVNDNLRAAEQERKKLLRK
jgi:flagellar biosynthesis GTPase FlhF